MQIHQCNAVAAKARAEADAAASACHQAERLLEAKEAEAESAAAAATIAAEELTGALDAERCRVAETQEGAARAQRAAELRCASLSQVLERALRHGHTYSQCLLNIGTIYL